MPLDPFELGMGADGDSDDPMESFEVDEEGFLNV